MKKTLQIHKLLLTAMKISLSQVFLAIWLMSSAFASDTNAQNMLNQRITLQGQDLGMRNALSQIEKQTDVKFVFSSKLIQSNRKVTVDFQNIQLSKILDNLLKPLQLTYAVSGNLVVINRATESVPPNLGGIQKLSEITNIAAIEVSGKISDESGVGIPGVTVLEKGTKNGTVSNVDGKFTLKVANANSTLVFSSVGFTNQEVTVGSVTNFNISLKPNISNLSEVVVVGYGVQKKATVSGSVVSVKGSDLIKSPTVNLSNSLAGRMAGVVAVNRSGEPGADGSAIRIRGSNTLNNGDALIVVDGIPNRAGGLDRINPNDIESVSVLKDASAAIYGSRAANGVILITTKRGKTGKPVFSYSANQGFSQPTVVPKLTSAAQYVGMLNDLDIYGLPVNEWSGANAAYKSTGAFTRPDGSIRKAPYSPKDIQQYEDGSDPWLHPNTDWYASTLKTWSPQTQHNLQISGGTEDIKYLASLGYQNQDGFYKKSATAYQQYDIRLNLDAKINKYIDVNVGLLFREEARNYPTRSAGAIFRMQMRGKPQQQAYWPNGLPGPDIENGENPVVITTDLSGYDRQKQDYIQTNGAVNIKIPWIEGLKFTGTAAIDKRLGTRKLWQIPWTLYQQGSGFEADGTTPKLVASKRGPAEPNLTQSYDDQLNILLGGVLSYETKLAENHNITVLAGTNRETIDGNNFNAFRRYFVSPALDQLFAGGDLERTNSGGGFETARINYFGRVAYNYKEKYLAEFLWRYDGSDRFPKATRYGFFPGVMAGWVMSEENFMKELPAISFMKLRGSWGQLGNDQVNLPNSTTAATYQYLSTYGFRSYILGDAEQKTLFETRLPNESITWEVASNSNIGLEGQLFKGKVSFEFDYFYNNRSKILWFKNASVPQSTGISLPAQNIGEVSNRGFDFTLGYRNEIGDLKYNVSINGGYAKNRIEFWDEAPGTPDWQRSTGRPMNTYVAYQYDGVFKDQAAIDSKTLDYSAIVKTLRPGDMKYKDYNGDGKITPDDQVRNDFTQLPMFQGGVNLGAQYKNFDLTVLIQGAAGAMQYVSAGEMGNIGNYLQDINQNRWTVDNPSDTHPRIANRSDQYYSSGNTYWLRSSDYIRLKNFELGYSLPESIGKKVGFSSMRIYASGINLFTIDKLKVFDPESSSSTGQYYPQSRVLNLGLNIKF